MSLDLFLSIAEQGLIYSLVVMAVFLTSRVIRFDDLTVEGSFGIGGVAASLVFLLGLSPWLSIPLSLMGGVFCGLLTGLLHTRFNLNNLISGLVVTTGLFSVSLYAAGANVVLAEEATLFRSLPAFPLFVGIALCAWAAVSLLLRSEIGLLLRTVGCNPQMITNLGRSIANYKILALMSANALTAMAGALFVQWCGFFSITSNVGTLIIGLAGLILGETIRPRCGFCLILGAILYQALFAFTIEMHLSPVWNNLIKAALIVVLIQLKSGKQIINRKQHA